MKALPSKPSWSRRMRFAPVSKEGFLPQARRISKIIAATVDLPLVPHTARVRWEATMAARRSERCKMGMPRFRAAAISALSSSMAVEITRASVAPVRPLPSWGNIRQPHRSSFSLQSFISSAKAIRSEPVTAWPLQARYWAMALMPEPMIPAKCRDEKFCPSMDKGNKHSL